MSTRKETFGTMANERSRLSVIEHSAVIDPLIGESASKPNRFIPALAGNTLPAATAWRSSTVHPRAGGEHACRAIATRAGIGSSPRGRGTLFSQPSDSANLF